MDPMTITNTPEEILQGVPFTALVAVEGMETCDGRLFEVGTTTWRDAPIPFRVQDTSSHGEGQIPEPAWAAGQLDTIYRDPNDPTRIMARGRMMPTATGARAEELARHAFRGVSIDAYGDSALPPELQPTVVDQDGDPLAMLVRFSDAVIAGLTMVPTPAFEACCLWFDDEPMPQIAADAHGAVIPADTAPEVVVVPNAYEQLVASAGGPTNPPRDWFFTPEPNEYQPVQVSADGRLTGHLARAGQCHVAYVGRCATAPESHTTPPFKAFHRTIARCDDNSEIACGWIAMDTDHGNAAARGSWSNEQTWDHYEHSGTLAAKVRASNGRHGIWLSGVLLPGLSERQLAIVQGLSVSGHWHTFADPESGRRFGDELLAVLGGVPQPGFPETRTRPELLVASGKIVGRVGQLDPCDCDEGEPMTPEERAEFDALKAEVTGLRALVASGSSGHTYTVGDMVDSLRATGMMLAGESTNGTQIGTGQTQALGTFSVPATVVSGQTAAEKFNEGLAKGIADGAPALTAAADLIVAQVEGRTIVDLGEPLTTAELARYVGRHDTDARTALAAEGHARPDGTVPIADEQDLLDAIRHYGANPLYSGHLKRAAARLGRDDLATGDWSGQIAFSQPA